MIFGRAKVYHKAESCRFQLKQKIRLHGQTKALGILQNYIDILATQKLLTDVKNRKYSSY